MRIFVALAAMILGTTSASASEWSVATTDHMIVYSEQSPEEAAKMAVRLERFDEAMRYMLNIEDSGPVPNSAKLTLFHFGDVDDIGQLFGTDGVAGFFIPRAGNSVAFAPIKGSRMRGSIGTREQLNLMSTTVVLFHEYAHYFMFQHAPAAYPSWYSEGFAEVYGTLKLKKDGFVLGAPASHRSDILHYLSAFPVRRLLDPPEKITGRDVLQRYAMGWLLTHYLTFSGQRRGQLDRYFTLLNFGSSNLEAAEAAFGNLEELDRELTRYQRGRIMGLTVKHDNYVPPEVTTRALTAAEVAVLPYVIQSARGVNEKQAADVVTKVREIAETYPKSVYVLLALAEAEIDAQFNDRAAAAARRVLEIEPDNAKAHIYLGRVARRAATEDHTSFATMRSEFANAVRLDRHNAEALYGYYLSYQLAGVTPPEHALIAVEMAYDFAPFDSSIRSTLAHLLLSENRDSEALVVLGPIINDPHGGKRAERYAELAEQIKDGNKEEALSELAPKIEEHPDEDEEDEELSVK